MPGYQGLSFVDNVAWWAEGKSKKEVAEAFGRVAGVALGWAWVNRVTFDHAKAEAMFLSKRRRKPTESVRVGEHEVPFNQHAMRWLGVWIDSKMTLKEHHFARMKKARRAMQFIRRLTGQPGSVLAPVKGHSWHACKRRRYTGPSCGRTTGKERG